MSKHTTRWQCRHCHQTITINVPINQPPTCHHWNTNSGHRPTPMDPTND